MAEETTTNHTKTKSRFNLDAIKAVGERASQKMTTPTQEQSVNTSKNPKGAGRKPTTDPAKNKISVNLTDTELEKLNGYCLENGMKPAMVLRYCLTKMDVL